MRSVSTAGQRRGFPWESERRARQACKVDHIAAKQKKKKQDYRGEKHKHLGEGLQEEGV